MAEVSVVMPVYNGEEYLSEAIESILNQTLMDLEFIIVCEYGTSERSIEIVNEYAEKDSRIIPIFNEERLGISASLNVGMRNAQGEYIARMDGDDIAGSRRLEIQKRFMDTYPEIGLCGTKHTVIGAPHWLVDYNTNPLQIKSDLLFFVPLKHPTIMIRKSVIEDYDLYYREDLPGTEDYDYFIRAARITKLTNILDKELFAYRRTEDNASTVYKDRDNEIKVSLMRKLLFDELQLQLNDEDIKILVVTTCFENRDVKTFQSLIKRLDALLKQIEERNREIGVYDTETLIQTFIHRWHRVRYNLNLKFKNNVSTDLLKCWREGKYYRSWLE